MNKPVIRTITLETLNRWGACDEGLALFNYLTKGKDRITMRFTAKDFLWMKNTFKGITGLITKLSSLQGLEALRYHDCYEHVHWLYCHVSTGSVDLLNDLIDNDVDIYDEGFAYIYESLDAPKGFSKREAYYSSSHQTRICSIYISGAR